MNNVIAVDRDIHNLVLFNDEVRIEKKGFIIFMKSEIKEVNNNTSIFE